MPRGPVPPSPALYPGMAVDRALLASKQTAVTQAASARVATELTASVQNACV